MKLRGAGMKYSKQEIIDGIKEWETSNLSWDEIEKKYNIPKAVMQYHRRKEKINNGNKQ